MDKVTSLLTGCCISSKDGEYYRVDEVDERIAELEADNKVLAEEMLGSLPTKLDKYAADAIREMLKEHFKKYKKGIGVNLLIETREILEYADKLEGEE